MKNCKLTLTSINQANQKSHILGKLNVLFSVRPSLILPGEFSHSFLRAPKTTCSTCKVTSLSLYLSFSEPACFPLLTSLGAPLGQFFFHSNKDMTGTICLWRIFVEVFWFGAFFFHDLVDAFSQCRNKYLLIPTLCDVLC